MSDETSIDQETGLTQEEIKAEYLRLLEWCKVCLGEDVAKVCGLTV